MVGLGLLSNLILILVGGFICQKKDAADRSLMMLSQAGYNIGNFTIPFVQGFSLLQYCIIHIVYANSQTFCLLPSSCLLNKKTLGVGKK